MAMTMQEAQAEGERRWGTKPRGRAWHMFPGDPGRQYFKLEWPDGVVQGQGKTFEEAFADADERWRAPLRAEYSESTGCTESDSGHHCCHYDDHGGDCCICEAENAGIGKPLEK